MRLTIARIVSIKPGPPVITTAAFIDGGEELVATGVGTYRVGQAVIVFFDDRYNRLKFHSPDTSGSRAIDK